MSCASVSWPTSASLCRLPALQKQFVLGFPSPCCHHGLLAAEKQTSKAPPALTQMSNAHLRMGSQAAREHHCRLCWTHLAPQGPAPLQAPGELNAICTKVEQHLCVYVVAGYKLSLPDPAAPANLFHAGLEGCTVHKSMHPGSLWSPACLRANRWKLCPAASLPSSFRGPARLHSTALPPSGTKLPSYASSRALTAMPLWAGDALADALPAGTGAQCLVAA